MEDQSMEHIPDENKGENHNSNMNRLKEITTHIEDFGVNYNKCCLHPTNENGGSAPQKEVPPLRLVEAKNCHKSCGLLSFLQMQTPVMSYEISF